MGRVRRTCDVLRLNSARTLCRLLPPLISQRIREVLCPLEIAQLRKTNFAMKSWTGSQLLGNTEDYHFCRFYFHRYFEWRNLVIARAVCSLGDTIVEVGANVGTETFSYADIVGHGGRVFAFEPVAANLARLGKSSDVNPDLPVTVFPIALAARRGRFQFLLPTDEYDSGLGRLAGSEDTIRSSTVEVEVSTLNDLAGRIGRASLIVIDVEGHELSVLQGAREYIEQHNPMIVLEADERWIIRAGATSKALYDELVRHSYLIYRISRYGLVRIGPDGPKPVDCSHTASWFAVPSGKLSLVGKVNKYLLRGGLTPLGVGLNPLEK
jgi:FkbM family methyltransferase